MKRVVFLLVMICAISCGEKLLEKPENLISKQKMVDILSELAVVNAAKNAHVGVLRANTIDPMEYIFKKYGIDSTQFVESDTYYASVPVEYEAIYVAVDKKLEKQKADFEAFKREQDSIRLKQRESKNQENQVVKKKVRDSLP